MPETLLDYLQQRLGPCAGNGPEYSFYCPFCYDRLGSESEKKKLRFNVNKEAFSCFRCRYGGHLWKFLLDLNGGRFLVSDLPFLSKVAIPPEKKKLSEALHEMFFRKVDAKGALHAMLLPQDAERIGDTDWDDPPLRLKAGVSYLYNRGVTTALASRFKLGYCSQGKFAQRVILPVVQGGRTVYFQARTVLGAEPKMLSPENVEGYYTRTECLFNYDSAVGVELVAVVEGPFDAMAFPCAVALMGKAASARQIELLMRLADGGTKELVVCLDSDAVDATSDLVQSLTGHDDRIRVTALVLDQGDPWDRRADLKRLLGERGQPKMTDVIRSIQHRGLHTTRKKVSRMY